MAGRHWLQSRSSFTFVFGPWLACVGLALGFALADPEPRLRHVSIVLTACFAAVTWIGTLGLVIVMRPGDWVETSGRFQGVRLYATAGATMTAVHIVFAFWLAHEWSHERAERHVADVGGSAEGIVVNYLFAVVWLADVLWQWLGPRSYLGRPRWVGYAVHGFLGFVVFQAAVVFGSPALRAVCLLLMVGLVTVWRHHPPAVQPCEWESEDVACTDDSKAVN